ncbi:peptidyl-tRNA hydrolase [Kwoniella shandongensis]|uniref:peptidyl-tRNA hydrolase n=1 Tax=Kwoniella shandongensis TaxID=1734106 RepID=A0A5M6C117_9TREE|nr:peptidyl-tRNA hydrolase [Kwoniella shandongensis]KAA5528684.1 peptidyl-tRNA hydrolase [Kwoniella shandongensis]
MSSFNIRMDGFVSPLLFSILAFAAGYQAHSLLSSRSISTSSSSNKSLPTTTTSSPRKCKSLASSAGSSAGSAASASDTESDSEDSAQALSSGLNGLKFSNGEEIKLVLVVNDELKMTKGKIAAQAGHATLAAAMTLKEANPRLFRAWQNQGQPKIALRCANTEELETLAAQALSLNICARTIRDAGRTQVAPGSKTIVGIGPGPARLINTVTGKLKLL